MAEETILSWNAANWVTILLMVFLGFAILGMVAKMIAQRNGAAAPAAA
jgi:hypothetical protein